MLVVSATAESSKVVTEAATVVEYDYKKTSEFLSHMIQPECQLSNSQVLLLKNFTFYLYWSQAQIWYSISFRESVSLLF